MIKLPCTSPQPQLGGRLLNVELVDQPDDEQFEYLYCSIPCLRAWLNSKLDELEALSEDFLQDWEMDS
ncbi:MAG: hypothetical protein WC423_27680 [Vulcanimicrobiota bacterium]